MALCMITVQSTCYEREKQHARQGRDRDALLTRNQGALPGERAFLMISEGHATATHVATGGKIITAL